MTKTLDGTTNFFEKTFGSVEDFSDTQLSFFLACCLSPITLIVQLLSLLGTHRT